MWVYFNFNVYLCIIQISDKYQLNHYNFHKVEYIIILIL